MKIAAFNLDESVANPMLGQFDNGVTKDLYEIAEHYDIPFLGFLVKRELKAVLLNGFIEKGIFNSQDVSVARL